MDRELRLPLAQEEFDKLEMPVIEVEAGSWFNLRFRQHANPDNLFYAKPGSRLTPRSRKVPCLYLAGDLRTCFFEIYGDRLYAAKQAKTLMEFSEVELDERVFVGIESKGLRLCDLAREGGASKLNLDQGTLWAADLKYPQLFAEAIHRHPAEVDGIRYRSRHTDKICVSLWNRPAAKIVDDTEVLLRRFLRTPALALSTLFDEPVRIAGTEKTFNSVLGTN